MDISKLRDFLDGKVDEYNRPSFIVDDPVSIPHLFSQRQDIEIAGFFAAIFAWGNRTIIINKSRELMQLMDMKPFEFCLHHSATDLKRLLHFRHRTFNATDLLYFIQFFKFHYARSVSLEDAFFPVQGPSAETNGPGAIAHALIHFRDYFFSLEDFPSRTKKHIASPAKGSNCKRLNMFLRWMVRRDDRGVDFGIWHRVAPSQLICPVDVHVARVAKRFGLLERKNVDWQAALELTGHLRALDPIDPVKYDFALFGLGVIEKYY